MDWLSRMNSALDYIEDNLAGQIDPVKISSICCCSMYQFQKIFSLMSGIPLSEYIRNRRLSKAAFDLQHNDARIIDIAGKYGYESPTAFNRAFQKLHGLPPNLARSQDITIKAYPSITFQISIKGAVTMDYRIKDQGELRVVGITMQATMKDNQQFKEIPAFWGKAYQDGSFLKLVEMAKTQKEGDYPRGILGISIGDGSNETFQYAIAVVTDGPVPQGMEELTLPAVQYAIFPCVGPMPDAIQKMSERIMTEWFPSSGYEFGKGADLEVYSEGDTQDPDYKSEIWTPVKQKDK